VGRIDWKWNHGANRMDLDWMCMFIGTLIRLGVEEIETMAMVCVVAVRVCWPTD
jgi:hypothetical protein